MPPQIPQGLDGLPPPTLPSDYAGFRTWFPNFIRRVLANADVRNANEGTGINISGSPVTKGGIGLSAEVLALQEQPYILAAAPVAPAELTAYRTLAAESGVLSITDGGAEEALALGVVANGIGNAQIRQGAAASVVGNSTNAPANVADIVAGADGNILQRVAGALVFAPPVKGAYSLQTPLTGFSITIGAGIQSLVLNPSGTLAAGTIILPATPGDNWLVRVSTSQTISSLAVNGSGGDTVLNAPTTITAAAGFSYLYILSLTTWFRQY